MKPIKGISINDISNDTSSPNLKTFNLTIDELGTDSCLLIDFGDPESSITESGEAYGNQLACLEYFIMFQAEKNKYNFMGLLENELISSHYYIKPGDYRVTVKAFNSVTSPLIVHLDLTVIEIDCDPPEVSIHNSVESHLNATEIWKSKPIQLYSQAFINCNASITVHKYWSCFKLDSITGEHNQTIDLSSLDSYRKTFLYVPAFYLEDAIYEFRFTINLTNNKPHPLLPFSGYGKTFVSVVRSPIMGKMTAGAESRVVRGWGQRLQLNPSLFSIDPDDESNKNFNITWFCRRLPSEKIDRQQPDEEMPISEAINDHSLISEDRGGCFAGGPGRIKVNSSGIDWVTSVFYKAGFTYEILIRIDPPDRNQSWSGIQLVLLEQIPPSITIQCQTASLCYPHVPIGQKINPVRVGLIGVCTESCSGQLTYEWTVFGVDTDTSDEVMLEDASKYMVGLNDVKLALGKEFFDEYYPKYLDFSLKLSVINEAGDRGESDIFIHINQPPTGGDCNITSDGSTALIDTHYVSCWNWIDPEFKPIEYYAFWIMNSLTGTISYLVNGPEKRVSLILPVGDFILGADIKDKEGAVSRLNISSINSKPPTQQQFDAFMDLKQLDNADASGDQSKMSMISQAIASIMNIDLPDSSISTTTTTTTTTMASVNKTTIKSEARLEEEAKTRAKMVESVENIMSTDTLNSLEQVGSILSAIAGRGKGVDNQAKEIVIRLLNKTISLASSIEVESPQQLLDFCMFAVGTMGAIVNVSN